MIADTSFIIDVMLNDSSAVRKAADIEGRGLSLSVGSPTIFELYVGVSLSSKAEQEKSKIMAVIGSLPQLPLDSESAMAAGSIYGQKVKSGLRMDPEDAMVAGIARIRGDTIITRNVRHFSGIEGVGVEGY